MVQALEAIVYALAPAFAAGFAIQKLLEIFDAFFSWLADSIAKFLDGRLRSTVKQGSTVNQGSVGNQAKWEEILEQAKKLFLKLKNGSLSSREITKAESELTHAQTMLKDQTTESAEVKKAKENVEEKKKEFVKGIKVLLTGVAAIGIASWVVSNSSISVIEPLTTLMNNNTNTTMNLTTNMSINATTAGANKAFYITPRADYWITILFIAAGTDGVNSILKYLGYAKEKKNEDVSADTE